MIDCFSLSYSGPPRADILLQGGSPVRNKVLVRDFVHWVSGARAHCR